MCDGEVACRFCGEEDAGMVSTEYGPECVECTSEGMTPLDQAFAIRYGRDFFNDMTGRSRRPLLAELNQ